MNLSTPIQKLLQQALLLEIWVVAGLVLLSMLSTRLLPVAVGAALLFWLLRWLATRKACLRTPADLAVILLLLTLPVTLWVTRLPEVTRLQALRLLSGVGLYYAIANWSLSSRRVKLILTSLALAGGGLALSAPFSVNWSTIKVSLIPPALYERFSVLVADAIHPNVLAGNLALLCPLALAWLLFGWKQTGWGERILFGAASAGMLLVVFLSKSRAGWIALAAAILLLLVLRWRWSWALLPLSAGLAVFAAWRTGFSETLELLISSGSTGGFEGRIEIWKRAAAMTQDFPLTGIGMGTFMETADRLYPFFLVDPGTIEHAHNLYLQIALDLGLAGLVAWLAIFFGLILAAWRLHRRLAQGDRLAQAIGAGFLSASLALGVHGLVDAVVWGMVRPAPLLWAVWGLAAAAANLYLAGQVEETTLPG